MLNELILRRSRRRRLALVGLVWLVVHPCTFAVATALLAPCAVAFGENEPPDGNPRTVYFTVGDAQDLLEFAPLDSPTSIATAFETLSRDFGYLVTGGNRPRDVDSRALAPNL